MKNSIKIICTFMLLVFVTTRSQAQIFVRIRPARPVVVVNRPPAPSPAHVWIDEEWAPSGAGYAWHGGYWAAPPRPGAVWIRGHWVQRPRGWVWKPGHWRY